MCSVEKKKRKNIRSNELELRSNDQETRNNVIPKMGSGYKIGLTQMTETGGEKPGLLFFLFPSPGPFEW